MEYLWQWKILATQNINSSSVIIAGTLIKAGYNVNLIIDHDGCLWQNQRVKRLSPTLLDYIMHRIFMFHDQQGVRSTEEIATLNQILRMVIAAGGKSSYELQQDKK